MLVCISLINQPVCSAVTKAASIWQHMMYRKSPRNFEMGRMPSLTDGREGTWIIRGCKRQVCVCGRIGCWLTVAPMELLYYHYNRDFLVLLNRAWRLFVWKWFFWNYIEQVQLSQNTDCFSLFFWTNCLLFPLAVFSNNGVSLVRMHCPHSVLTLSFVSKQAHQMG